MRAAISLTRNAADLTRHHSERHWSDATISNKHLRIHCILYDKNGNGEVPPLVYATDVSSNGTYLKKNNAACVDAQSGRAVLMTRKQGAFLLDDQDELRISDTVTLIYHTLEPTSESSLTETQKSEVQQFASEYLLTGRLLGKGGFGKVVVGIHQNSIRQVACKIVNLKTLSPRDPMPTLLLSDRGQDSGLSNTPGLGKRWSSKVTRCSREFMILKELSHPNVINVEKVFWSSDTIYMFQELITGGDLFSYMERKGDTLTSLEAATIILQLLKAVDYLHDRNIVHRDLKPDNILLAYPEDGTRIVVTDFGNARVVPSRTGSRNGRMFTNAGTVEYIAPEIYEKNSTLSKGSGYSKAVDMWSIGVIASNLLSHEALFAAPPHEADPHAYVLKLAARCDISIMDDGAHPAWSKVGDKPKDFIRQLLVLQEDDRMSVKQALAHPWFTNPYLAQEFEALYARSIRDWQPRCKVSKLIEPLELGSSKKRVADQTTAACVQEASNCVSCDIQDVSSASQDWDLSIVYPPLGDDSILPDQERAEYERPNRDDHRSIELGVRAAYNDSQNSVDTSMVRISLGHGESSDTLVCRYICLQDNGFKIHQRQVCTNRITTAAQTCKVLPNSVTWPTTHSILLPPSMHHRRNLFMLTCLLCHTHLAPKLRP